MSRELTIQSDALSSKHPPDILVRLGLLSNEPIPASLYQQVIYAHRMKIEKAIALMYRYDPEVFAEEIKTLIDLIYKTTRGTYKQAELEAALTTVMSALEELQGSTTHAVAVSEIDREEPLLRIKSFEVKKKLNSAIQVRSLSARIFEAVITLISAFPQESVSQFHQDTFELQEALRVLSSLLAFIRASLTIIAAIKHATGYHISEEEKNLTALVRLKDQIQKNAPQLLRDIIWSIVRFVGWQDKNLQKNLMEMTLGLFGFVFLQSIAVHYNERQFYNQMIAQSEKENKFRTNAEELNTAITIARNETIHQNNIQILIWFLYVIGALICVIGKECSKTSEKIELALGSVLIVLTCIGQILWDRSKPNLMTLVTKVSEITATSTSYLPFDTSLALSVDGASDDAEKNDREPMKDTKEIGSEDVSPLNSHRLFKATSNDPGESRSLPLTDQLLRESSLSFEFREALEI